MTEIFFGPDLLGLWVIEALETAVGPEVAPFVSQWFEEARQLSEENPPGSSKYEQDDCGPYVEMLEASAARI